MSGLYTWSRTASANASSDTAINWAEGQSPSSVNNSARGMMASTAKWRDDISGALLTDGTSTAYTVVSNQGFDTLAHMDGAMIAFTPHATNGATVTLNVDGLGAKPLRVAPSVDLQSNVLILGTPYVATYYNASGEWILHGIGGNAYGIPLGAGVDYWLPITPSSAFVFPTGQAISRTTYATLFAAMGTTYGSGDGSTTFNLPNKVERVSVMKAASASLLTSTYFGGDSTALGATGGGESKTLLTTNLPPYTPAGSVTSTPNLSAPALQSGVQNASSFTAYTPAAGTSAPIPITGSIASTFAGTAQGGMSTPVRTVQPTIVCNYILRVI